MFVLTVSGGASGSCSVVESGEAFSLKEVLLEYGQEDPADAGECEGAGWGSPGL